MSRPPSGFWRRPVRARYRADHNSRRWRILALFTGRPLVARVNLLQLGQTFVYCVEYFLVHEFLYYKNPEKTVLEKNGG